MSDSKTGKMQLLLIFLTVFIDLIGFGIVIPLLPTFAEKFGADATTVGLLLMSYSLMQFLFTPFWGRLSDKIGRRPVLLISLCASAIGYLIWGFADSLALLFASRIIAGFGNANIAVAAAYIADVTDREKRAGGMALIGIAFGLGFVMGPAIAGMLHGLGTNNIGFVAAAFSLIDLVLTYFLLPEPKARSNAGHERFKLDPEFYRRTFANRQLQVPLAIFFISTFAFANLETTLVLLAERRFHFGIAENSWMFAYIGILMVFVQGGVGRLAKRLGEKPLVVAGTALVALGLLAVPFCNSVPMLYGALAVLALGTGINTPSNQSLLSKFADPDDVGGVLGIGQSLSTLGRILGPVLGGYAFEKLSQNSPYFIGAVIMALGFALSLLLPAATKAARRPSGQDPAASPDPEASASQDGLNGFKPASLTRGIDRQQIHEPNVSIDS